jgi:hypothetical protein
MYFLLQTNVSQADSFNELLDAVSKHAEYRLVKTIPFTNIIVDNDVDINNLAEDSIPDFDIENDQSIMTMGSYTLVKIAKQRGWEPAGDFVSNKFNFDNLKKHYGCQNMLNGQAIQGTMGDIDIPDEWEDVFARPVEDTKSFAGGVFDKEVFKDFLKTIVDINDELLNAETPIIVAPVQEILAEYRLFVVDGEIVAGSLYRILDETKSIPMFRGLTPLDDDVSQEDVCVAFAKDMLRVYQPERAFVLDVAITLFGPKIIEVNNINSSGFYASDVENIVVALNNM